MQKHIAMTALLLWMGVLCGYGQTDSVATCTTTHDEIQENYLVTEMDSITTERVQDQIILQQFVESIPEINASCPTTLYGNLTLDSLSFSHPQVCYHVSIDSKDYTQSKEDGALWIILSRTTHFFKIIKRCHLGLTYLVSFKDTTEKTEVVYTPEEISDIFSQEVPKERVLKYFHNLVKEVNETFPTTVDRHMRIDSMSIDKGYMQYHYTVFEDKNFNIKMLKKNIEALKANTVNVMMDANSSLFLIITGCSIMEYGLIFRFVSSTNKRKHVDVVFTPDEVNEIELFRRLW